MIQNNGFTVFDGHNDMILRYLREGGYDFFTRTDNGHLDFERCKEAGFGGGFFAVYVPKHRGPDAPKLTFSDYLADDGSYSVPLAEPLDLEYARSTALELVARLFRIEEQSKGQFQFVRTADELEDCIANGTMAGILHFEGADPIDTDLYMLDIMYQAGLRSLGPVWSRPTAFAEGVPFRFPHSPDTGPGLTDAGKRLIRECNRLGIMIDLSHITEKGFWDVAEISDAPLVATHSNAHALCPNTRNLTDRQLEAIKETDGMVGLNFGTVFLREDGLPETDVPIDIMVRHIDYLVDKVGIDRVGFGSDFDGVELPDDIGTVLGLPVLINALKDAGYDDESLHKITHKNWIRVLRKTWK